jgi:hypothetical protein
LTDVYLGLCLPSLFFGRIVCVEETSPTAITDPAARYQSNPHQKMILSASWMIRGSFAARILPNPAELTVWTGLFAAEFVLSVAKFG